MNSSNEMLQKFLLFAFVIFITSRGVRPRSFVATRNVAEREAPFLHRLRRCRRAWGPSYPSSTTTSKHHLLLESPPALHPASTSSFTSIGPSIGACQSYRIRWNLFFSLTFCLLDTCPKITGFMFVGSLRYRASEMGSLPSLWTWIPLLVSMGG